MTARTLYEDFDVRLNKEDGNCVARVIESPAGPSGRIDIGTLVPGTPHRELMLRLENAVLRANGRHRGPTSKEERVLQDFGSTLFDALFRSPSKLHEKFASSLGIVESNQRITGLRIKLRLDSPELARLPWEYLYDEQKRDYLCLRQRSPVSRFLEVDEPHRPPLPITRLNILGMIANPGGDWDLLDVDKERRLIDEAIGPMHDAGQVHFEWVRGETVRDLLSMMQRGSWHVFHFIGHGGVFEDGATRVTAGDIEQFEEGYLVLGDGHGGAKECAAGDLKYILQSSGSLRLIVLNCCESARGSAGDVFSSPGAALVKAGIPSAIAMQFPISNEAATAFSSTFYESLVNGAPAEEALTWARVQMHEISRLEWGIPVLFTSSPTGQLFSFDEAARTARSAVPEPRAPTPAYDQAAAQAALQRYYATRTRSRAPM